MTEIFHNNGVSVQVLNSARQNINSMASANVDINLDTPGRFLGAGIVIDRDGGAADAGLVLKKQDNTELAYGDEITGVRVLKYNNSGAALQVGAHVTIYVGY